MFWCMFACDITAFYCDILQDCSGGQVFHSVNVMRIHALTCGLLQDSGIWTQNPPIARSWGFDPPLPAPNKYNRINGLQWVRRKALKMYPKCTQSFLRRLEKLPECHAKRWWHWRRKRPGRCGNAG
jgi:hypothetical protein